MGLSVCPPSSAMGHATSGGGGDGAPGSAVSSRCPRPPFFLFRVSTSTLSARSSCGGARPIPANLFFTYFVEDKRVVSSSRRMHARIRIYIRYVCALAKSIYSRASQSRLKHPDGWPSRLLTDQKKKTYTGFVNMPQTSGVTDTPHIQLKSRTSIWASERVRTRPPYRTDDGVPRRIALKFSGSTDISSSGMCERRVAALRLAPEAKSGYLNWPAYVPQP